MTATFADETGLADLDEDGEAVIVPSIAAMSVLPEYCHACPPQASLIEEWKTRYLEIFEAQKGYYSTDEFQQERRTVLVDTFERLAEQSRAFWGDTDAG